MPRKRTAPKKVATTSKGKAEKAKPAKRTVHLAHGSGKGRKTRATAKNRAGGVKKSGSQRGTNSETAARNAKIAEMREVEQMEWMEIAAVFGVNESTCRRGYDSHVAARDKEAVTFVEAMQDMRLYVAVIRRNRQVLARIAHELPVRGEVVKKGEVATQTKFDPRTRIAAIHEQSDLIFKEIAIRQAVGDLPADFSEMVAARDFDDMMNQVLALLDERGLSREVFAEINEIIRGRMDVTVPKTHLAAV